MFEKFLKEIKEAKDGRLFIKIDGESILAHKLNKDDFIEAFYEFVSPAISDDGKYLVLYDPFSESFWHIPVAEFSEDDLNTLLECIDNKKSYEADLQEFRKFFAALCYYVRIMDMKHRDQDTYRLYKAIKDFAYLPEDADVIDDNKVCVVCYFREHWKAWYDSILNREYKYMNICGIVLESWQSN